MFLPKLILVLLVYVLLKLKQLIARLSETIMIMPPYTAFTAYTTFTAASVPKPFISTVQ
jgi:hypothetical protein